MEEDFAVGVGRAGAVFPLLYSQFLWRYSKEIKGRLATSTYVTSLMVFAKTADTTGCPGLPERP